MILAFMPQIEIERLYAGKELERFSEHTATTLRGVARQARAGPQRRHRLERRPFRARHQLGGGARCSTSPARRSARSTCRDRSAPSPARSAARSSARSCAPPALEISRRLGWIGADPAREVAGMPLVAGCTTMDLGLQAKSRSSPAERRASGSPPRGSCWPKAPRSRSAAATKRGSRRRNPALLGNAADDDAARDALRRARQGRGRAVSPRPSSNGADAATSWSTMPARRACRPSPTPPTRPGARSWS